MSENIGEKLTEAMRGVFTVYWNQPDPDESGEKLIPNEVVHTLIQRFETVNLLKNSGPADILGRASEHPAKCQLWDRESNGGFAPLDGTCRLIGDW